MKYILTILLIVVASHSIHSQNFPQMDYRLYVSDSVVAQPYRPWVAVAEVIGVNLLVGSFNRYLMNEDFAKINFKSIKRNFKIGPVWDTDKFSTNMVAHPYHGSLYYNAARSNGMNFWQSIPFTVGGSFMWEFFMETEPPSINDLMATTFGGVELGEITYRLSDLFIDNRSRGAERVGREVLSGVISPIRALNRIITGDAWHKGNTKGRNFENVPVNFVISLGPRYLAEREDSDYGVTSLHLGLQLDYGQPYGDDFYSPYEWFRLRAGFDFFSKQPLISQVNAIGALWGKTLWTKGERALSGGVFQHFDYYESEMKPKDGDGRAPVVSQTGNVKPYSPYKLGQAAAVGVGVLYNKISEADKVDVYAELYANGIALGASQTDYFFVDERDYNLGSGYSVKMFTGLTYKQRWSFLLNTENYHIFTWKGYDPDLDLNTVDYETLNVQGDKGNARLTVFSANLTYYSGKKWNLSLTNRYFSRRTHYHYHEDVTTSTYDIMLSFGVKL